MSTVSRGLPERPHLDVPKREARQLLNQWRKRDPDALDRIRRRHQTFKKSEDAAIAEAQFRLSDAQLVIAREYGFSNWTQLKQRIEVNAAAVELDQAIRGDAREAVVRIIQTHPQLLHLPVWSGNWGPPMSHAANLGRLEIIQAIAELGAQDFQHAFDRALLQGRIECARWLHGRGAKLAPGIIMGCCETLKLSGLKLLLELGAPLTDHQGDRLAPLALVLETYCRNPAGKHAILDLFQRNGYKLPDTPMMAFHRGDIPRLEAYLQSSPDLLTSRFTLPEIYLATLGCGNERRSGLHWTPINGTTLLHLSIDFAEKEIFEWLLARGANVNATATVDADGFGGHTPIFHTVVCGPGRDTSMIEALLQHGARTGERVNLRKFLDWCEEPRWHEARNVTAAEWGRGFPDKSWVNSEALRVLG